MNHAGFAIEGGFEIIPLGNGQSVAVLAAGAVAGGDLTRSTPPSSMSWTGVVVGATHSEANLVDVFQGTANLRYTPMSGQTGTVDASFRDFIRDDTGAPYALTLPGFRAVPVTAFGTYAGGSPGNSIQGAFYGPSHAETAGTFEQNNVFGAFGARRN